MPKTERYIAEIFTDHPPVHGSELADGVMHIVQDATTHKNKWAYFKCPCGCGEVARLSLQPKQQPHYSLNLHGHAPSFSDFPSDHYADATFTEPTLIPSVFARGFKCQSHFSIEKGVVRWV